MERSDETQHGRTDVGFRRFAPSTTTYVGPLGIKSKHTLDSPSSGR